MTDAPGLYNAIHLNVDAVEVLTYFPGIEDGTYKLIVEAQNTQYEGQKQENVVVKDGVVTNIGTIILTLFIVHDKIYKGLIVR